MFARISRFLPLLTACASAPGCAGADDGKAASGGRSSVGGAALGGSTQTTTGGSGGASGGAEDTTPANGGTTGATGGASAGTSHSTGGLAGTTAGAGNGGASPASGGASTNSGGSTARSGGTEPVAGTGGTASTAGGAGAGGSGGGGGTAPSQHFSFFVASMKGLQKLARNPEGFGGDLRYDEADGLTGADKICAELAESSLAGSAAKQWRAFLSVTEGLNGGPVNAIDRIGKGPWYDRVGRIVSLSVEDLLNWRPKGADPVIINDLPNEFGVPNKNPDGTGAVDNHHVLTGSNSKGALDSPKRGNTCNDWTSAVGTTGNPQCGFSWPRGSSASDGHWIVGFQAHGCAAGVSIIQDGAGDGTPTVGNGGGYGAFYCFALTP